MSWISLVGLVALLGIAWLMSYDRRALPVRTICWGLGLQFLFALIILRKDEWSFIGMALFAALLVAYLLRRSGESLATLGVDAQQPGKDTRRGAALAALVGLTGLAWYLIAYRAGINLSVSAQGLPDQWWRTPVLVLGALENAVVEEVVVLGFVLHRLRQLGWNWTAAIWTSALIRGSYHLYQGFGGFVGNIVMGLLFGWLFKRWSRVMPMIIAHALIDSVAFIGYAVLEGRVAWLP